ncbi:unnamed protein product, partial [Didymodactylos carnosus]
MDVAVVAETFTVPQTSTLSNNIPLTYTDISITPQIHITDGFTEMEEIVLNGVDQSAVSKLND